MIQAVNITNHVGHQVVMDLFRPEKCGLIIEKIEGLGPVEAFINTTNYATLDGARFNSARIGTRNIEMTLRLLDHPTIEESRHLVYSMFPVKKQVKMEVITDIRSLSTRGYVESVTPDIFSNEEAIDISIICVDPFFHALTPNEVSFTVGNPLFEFPFSNEGSLPMLVMGEQVEKDVRVIRYSGDTSVGCLFTIVPNVDVAASADAYIELVNSDASENLYINIGSIPDGLHMGDNIIISTVKGNKYAHLLRGGIYYNIINAIDIMSDWIHLDIGANTIRYFAKKDSASDFDIELTIEYSTAYGGV